MLDDLLFRIRSLFRRKRADGELDDELRFHLERQTAKHVKSGLSLEEAQRLASMDLGGFDQVTEECRDARGVRPLENLAQDVRYALRTLRKSPAFTVIALLTLALGIGANTAIFSVVYAVLLRPLPFAEPSRLIVLNETTPKVGLVSVSYPNFLDWRAQSRSFSQMSFVKSMGSNLGGVEQPESISGFDVSTNYLSTLGVHPFLGRDFTSSEDNAGTAPVVMLTYPLWQSHFGADPNAIGRGITLDDRRFTIIGVLPPDFRSADKIDILEPIGVWLTGNAEAQERGERGDAVVVGRLAPGRSLAQARAEMEGIAARLAVAYPGSNDQFGAALQPIRDAFVGDIRPAILVLFAAVIFVLLIACANVANLFLMRGAGRAREIALRLAIGASRGRIVRQMLTESFVLASLGGVLGLALAFACIRGMARLIPAGLLGGSPLELSGSVLLFAAAVVVIAAFVFGLAPAIQSSKADVQSELKQAGRAMSDGAGAHRWRGALVVAEVSLALVLLAGAGLMMQSLYRLLAVDPGFRPERVLKMEMSLRTAQYNKDPAILNFWDNVLRGVRALPGVESAALGTDIPLTDSHSRSDITYEGMPAAKPGSYPHPDVHVATPGYVSTLGIPLLRGRAFSDTDTEKAPLVAMINAKAATQFFGKGDAVGKRFLFGHPSAKAPKWIAIVGVVADTKMYGLANPSRLEVYLPLRQATRGDMNLIVKSSADPAALTSAIRATVAAIDKDQPIFGISTMTEVLNDSVSTRRITLVLLGSFSALALILAAIGIYGVIAYSVAQRTHEIGIRMALGAQRGDVLRMVLVQGSKIAGAGIAIGIVASLALTRLMIKLLYSVSAADPLTFISVALVLALAALVACYIPARRTTRVDPLVALRYE